jgi:hypothetical protein
MRDPYKLMVWGPGRMGKMTIWQTTQMPEFELVGVRAYSEAKAGVDAGALIGVDTLGIKATTDVDTLLKTDCDCIVYTAHDEGTYHTDEEILQLLAAGKNVVTPLPYQNAHLFREAEFVKKLKTACAQGGSTFHAGGIDPDWMSERILLGLTGACSDVRSIKLQEHWDCSFAEEAPLSYVGFGKAPEEAEKVEVTKTTNLSLSRAEQWGELLTACRVLSMRSVRMHCLPSNITG